MGLYIQHHGSESKTDAMNVTKWKKSYSFSQSCIKCLNLAHVIVGGWQIAFNNLASPILNERNGQFSDIFPVYINYTAAVSI